MFVLVTGGSGSGKSEFAENIAMSYYKTEALKIKKKNKQLPFIYLATMISFDKETEDKINRHKRMREKKQFQTIECFTGLKEIKLPQSGIVLLDCISNLTANEMFQKNGAGRNTFSDVIEGITSLKSQCMHLIVVTNEIFSDGCVYEEDTKEYMKCLGNINKKMASMADQVVEVVCGIPVYI